MPLDLWANSPVLPPVRRDTEPSRGGERGAAADCAALAAAALAAASFAAASLAAAVLAASITGASSQCATRTQP